MNKPHTRSTVYAFRYSEGVIDAFMEKYSRVCNFVCKKVGLTAQDFKMRLVSSFMYHNAKWNVARETLKYIDKWNLYNEAAFLERPDFLKYLTAVQSLCEDLLIDTENLRKDVEKL